MPQKQPLRVLTPDQIRKIHETSVRILSEVGIKIDLPEAEELLLDAGAVKKNDRLLIPEILIEKTMACTPRSMGCYSRTGNFITCKGNKRSLVHNCGTVANIREGKNGGRQRPATLQDAGDLARLMDALDCIDAIVPIVYPQEVEQEAALFYAVRESFRNTVKPVCGPAISNVNEARFIHEMYLVLAGSEKTLQEKPMYDIGFSPISPLHYPAHDTEAAIWAARKKIPISLIPCPISGMTSPCSLLGSLTQQNAEMLGGLVLFRLIDPELAITYGGRLCRGDMRFGGTLGGYPETAVVGAGAVQMADFYGLNSNVYGADSNSNLSDCQAGMEKAFNVFLPAQIGSDWLSGAGAIDDGASVSYEQLVIDNEIFSMAFQMFGELHDDENDYGLQAITDAIESSSDFIMHESTIRLLRSEEQWVRPGYIGNIRAYGGWMEAGGKSMLDNAIERSTKILKEHEVPPLEAAQETELDKIIKSAASELKK